VSNLPANKPVFFFQGTGSSTGQSFGEGLRCTGGTVRRLGFHMATGTISSFPQAGDPPLRIAGAVPPAGAVRTYQVWYRDPAPFCNTTNFNLTNGLRASWTY